MVGSFNSYSSKLWGSFLLKDDGCDHALKVVEKQFIGVTFFELNRINDSQMIEKCLQDWAKGE